ncbi:MAG: DUF4167 domain-containing protein, partial [Actinomycetota bacterium]
MGDEAIRTAFHEVTEAQGGGHVADGGWMWLEGFGDVQKEYVAVRDDAAVWDVSPLNKWDFRGPDALRAAQRVFSNEVLGQGRSRGMSRQIRVTSKPMRQGQQNRRGRGRGRKPQNPLARSFESNGPDVKIRGTAAHIAEKYMSLARDALASGDMIAAES